MRIDIEYPSSEGEIKYYPIPIETTNNVEFIQGDGEVYIIEKRENAQFITIGRIYPGGKVTITY